MFNPKNADNLIFGIDLQLFSEGTGGDPGPISDPAPAEPTASVSENPRENMSLAEFFNRGQASESAPSNPEPVQEEPVQPPATEVNPEPRPAIDVPDKFKNPDGSVNVEALAKSYLNMEQMYSKSQNPQQFEALLAKNQELEQKFSALINMMQEQNAPKEPEISPEERQAKEEADKERLLELMYENPRMAIKEILEAELAPFRQAQQQEANYRRFERYLSSAADGKPDFEEMLPHIKEQLLQLGDDVYIALEQQGRNPIEMAYNLAKAGQAGTQPEPTAEPPKAPTVEELTANQEFLAQIAQNPAVKKLILQQHVQELKNNPAPPVIGSQPGGLPPSTEPVDLKNIKTAKEALMAKYRGLTLG